MQAQIVKVMALPYKGKHYGGSVTNLYKSMILIPKEYIKKCVVKEVRLF